MYNRRHYEDCRLCELHKTRYTVCQYRTVPKNMNLQDGQILWLGEAPGSFENFSGLPFTGPAGKVLDHLLRTLSRYYPQRIHVISNMVMCYPHENGKIRPPTNEEAKACAPRLREFIKTVEPLLIILMGDRTWELWKTFHQEHFSVSETLKITHPAHMLRSDEHQGTQMFFEAVADVRTELEMLYIGDIS